MFPCRDELSVIFSFLPLEDLVNSKMLVCKYWREAAFGNLGLWTALLNTHFRWEDFVNPMFPEIEIELQNSDEGLSDHYDYLEYLFSIIPKFISVEERNEDVTIVQGDSLSLEQVFTFSFPLLKNTLVGEFFEIRRRENLMKLVVIMTSLISDEYRPNPVTDQVILHQCFWDDNSDIVKEAKILIPFSLFCFIILISEGDEWFSCLDLLFFKKRLNCNVKYSKIVYGVSPYIITSDDDSEEEEEETSTDKLEQYLSQQITPFCYFSNLDGHYTSQSSTSSSWEDYDKQMFPIFFNAGAPYSFYEMRVTLNEKENLIIVEKVYGSGYY
ncbi:predicted protein [Naegleria gruberi]|uniref:Predicted protein n=1 Tax=Naegleria gruberi TaxID=5762 RepID=D2V3C6_NAEGR|nr:uncharacterized protein NAEGRDRAFT_46368 [Naegleria gruberi]EFC48749.1 predicted protein [Naegleria gruberi]|eukprot:XP_002681493.1 predicted protein [Naegleria gruberi strain NEG-M]